MYEMIEIITHINLPITVSIEYNKYLSSKVSTQI